MAITTCVFDAYGTLFDVTAAARRAADEGAHPALAGRWPALAAHWRERQLQYAWVRSLAGAHADFWQVTGEALDHALEAEGIGGDAALRDRLMDLYRTLDAYPEAPAALAALREAGLGTAILSNGSPAMLEAAVGSAGLAPLIDIVLSVEDAGIYKPAPAAYALVGERLGPSPGAVLFVSSNGWDAAGAAGYGFVTAWVNRAGAPAERLPWRPAHVVPDLAALPALVAGL